MLEFALEVILCLLMIPTIVWSIVIHRKLRRLRTDQGEMTAFIEALNETIVRAERAVGTLQAVGRETIERHDNQQAEARKAADEIARGIQSAARLLRRLDTALQQGTKLLAETRTADRSRGPMILTTAMATSPVDHAEVDGGLESADLDPAGIPKTAKGRDLLRALAALR